LLSAPLSFALAFASASASASASHFLIILKRNLDGDNEFGNAKCIKDASLANANEQMTLAGIFRGRPLEQLQPPEVKTKQHTAKGRKGRKRRKSCLSRRRVFASWRTTTATAITAHNVNSSSSESESEVLFTRRLQLTAQKTGGQNGEGDRGWKTKQHLKVKANGKVC